MKTIVSPLSKRERVFSSSGNRFRYSYIRVDDPDGHVYLKKVDKIDIKEEINSARPPEVGAFVTRYLRGDRSALGDPSRAQYLDVSGIGDYETLIDNISNIEFFPGSSSESAEAVTPESEVIEDAES